MTYRDGDPFLDEGKPVTCAGCGKPILIGQARYTLGEFRDPPEFRHYECNAVKLYKDALDGMNNALDRAHRAISKLRRER